MELRVTTFNCENLFGRYRFLDTPPSKRGAGYEKKIQIFEVIALEPGRSGKIKPKTIAERQRKNTAAAILAANPDIMAVAEVENLPTLRLFNSRYLGNYFERIVMLDGNDPRGIDVGLLLRRGLKADILRIQSHADEARGGGYLPTSNRLDTKNGIGKAAFSRDCLEVDIEVNNTVLTFLVNHLKAQDGKPETTQKRHRQANRVSELVGECCDLRKTTPIVLGDLNVDVDGSEYDGSLDPLVNSGNLYDPFSNVQDKWTHYYSSKKTVSRLDYVLVDKSLKSAVEGTEIFRGGLTPKCKQYAGKRVGTIAKDALEASDHCPVTVLLDI